MSELYNLLKAEGFNGGPNELNSERAIKLERFLGILSNALPDFYVALFGVSVNKDGKRLFNYLLLAGKKNSGTNADLDMGVFKDRMIKFKLANRSSIVEYESNNLVVSSQRRKIDPAMIKDDENNEPSFIIHIVEDLKSFKKRESTEHDSKYEFVPELEHRSIYPLIRDYINTKITDQEVEKQIKILAKFYKLWFRVIETLGSINSYLPRYLQSYRKLHSVYSDIITYRLINRIPDNIILQKLIPIYFAKKYVTYQKDPGSFAIRLLLQSYQELWEMKNTNRRKNKK